MARRFLALPLLVLAACDPSPGPKLENRRILGAYLAKAAVDGDLPYADYLIRAGADVNTRLGWERAPNRMFWDESWTPLLAAVDRGDHEMVRVLLEAGADPDLDDDHGTFPLEMSLTQSTPDERIVLRLIRAGADVTRMTSGGWCGVNNVQTPMLHLAVGSDLPRVVRELMKRGAPVSWRTSRGHTPTHFARSAGILNLLKPAGADLEATDGDGHTPLAVAIDPSDPARARMFIEAGARIDARCRHGTVLHHAVQENSMELVRELVNRGADLEATDGDGETALQVACHQSAAEGEGIALFLLARGARARVGKDLWDTPLYRSVTKGRARVVRALLEHGADVHARDECGWTSLHQACLNFRGLDVIEALVEAGADVRAMTDEGRTPLESASSDHRAAIGELLRGGR